MNNPWKKHRESIAANGNIFKEQCAQKILQNMYTRSLSLDDCWCEANMALLSDDVDGMLTNVKMTPFSYLHACKSLPSIRTIIESIEAAASEYTDKENANIAAQEKDNVDVPPDDVDADEVDKALVKIQKNESYEDFIKRLEDRTKKKIINDVAELIADKKSENDMEFAPKTESFFSQCMQHLYTEQQMIDDDAMIGLSIRESTIHELDTYLRSKNPSSLTNVRLGHGAAITNEAIEELMKNK